MTKTVVQLPASEAATGQVQSASGSVAVPVDAPVAVAVAAANGFVNPERAARVAGARPASSAGAKAKHTPFRRVRVEDHVVDSRLADNSYLGKAGQDRTEYGYKAHQALIVTRGKGFTKEKNKHKKGKHGGGFITMESHSIKFD